MKTHFHNKGFALSLVLKVIGFGTWKWHILINTSRQLCATVELFWNILYEPLQSAYKKFHGPKTALKKVDSDIVTAIDSGHSVILVLLDLSAAFDTVDHTILTRRLSTRFGIRGRALDWFVSYLSDRTQYMKVNDTLSKSLYLTQGVPQGSVLGSILYSLYTSPSNIKWITISMLMTCNCTYYLKHAVQTVQMMGIGTRPRWRPAFVISIFEWYIIDSS